MATIKQLIIDEVSKKLVDDGKLIEVGFYGFRKFVIPANAPALQIDECRMAFFAGAQHLFASMMSIMEDGDEPTDNDERRMDQINSELARFVKELEARVKAR